MVADVFSRRLSIISGHFLIGMGLIIEKITVQSYFDYVRENIFSHAGMVTTDAFELDAVVSNLTIGHTTQDTEGNETGTLTDNTSFMLIKVHPPGAATR